MEIDKSKCLICNTTTIVEEVFDRSVYKVNCPRCGSFEITDRALILYQQSTVNTKVHSISFWLRRHQTNSGGHVLIDVKMTRELLSIPFIPPKPKQQADYLLSWMGNTLIKPNQSTSIQTENLISVVGAFDLFGVVYIAKFLVIEDLISCDDIKKGLIPKNFNASMTFKGWERFYELQQSNKDSRLAFMAMKFSNNTLAFIFNTVIKESVAKTGFEIRRLDEERRAGLIDDKLRVEIRRSKFLIADLTDDNNGAYWEAGYAEGLGMPVIYICEEEKFKDKKTHFDTNHHLTLTWKNTKEGLERFSEELKATIRSTFPLEAKMDDV